MDNKVKGSVKSQVYFLLNVLDGIGKSKKEMRSGSVILGENGRQVSPLIHSYKYRNDIKNTATQLLNFAKEDFNIKNAEYIDNDVIKSYILKKLDAGVTYRSISTYIGHLRKIMLGLQKISEYKEKKYKAFDEDGVKIISALKKEKAYKTKYKNRAYVDVENILSNLKNEENILVAKVQLEAGVRVTEGLKFRLDQMKNNNQIEVKIKGGNTILVTVKENTYNVLLAKINKAIEKGEIGFRIQYDDYYSDLKQAVESTVETWNGTHGMRYVYAQRRMNELSSEMSFEEARLIVSKEMGHHRANITSHYLG